MPIPEVPHSHGSRDEKGMRSRELRFVIANPQAPSYRSP